MPDLFVDKISDFAEGDRRIVSHDGLEIGVFRWQGQFYAYRNLCLHQGGPCCEGVIMHKVEDVLAPDQTWLGQRFSEDERA
jgi:nitrite reductase/ring-hydroxylating ferredoxin subunit